jgi:hypothetical protein
LLNGRYSVIPPVTEVYQSLTGFASRYSGHSREGTLLLSGNKLVTSSLTTAQIPGILPSVEGVLYSCVLSTISERDL